MVECWRRVKGETKRLTLTKLPIYARVPCIADRSISPQAEPGVHRLDDRYVDRSSGRPLQSLASVSAFFVDVQVAAIGRVKQ